MQQARSAYTMMFCWRKLGETGKVGKGYGINPEAVADP